MSPWTLLGWALLGLLAIAVPIVIVAAVAAVRMQRRFDRHFADREAEHDARRREIEERIARGARPPGPRFKL